MSPSHIPTAPKHCCIHWQQCQLAPQAHWAQGHRFHMKNNQFLTQRHGENSLTCQDLYKGPGVRKATENPALNITYRHF